MYRVPAMLAFAALAVSSPLAAQAKPPAKDSTKVEKMDHSKMDHGKMDHAKMDHAKMDQAKSHGGNHAASGWKELDGYHQLMMQTWHPIKEKGDVGPIKAKALDMVASAKLLAKSKAPKGCDTPALKTAASELVGETESVAALVSRKGGDAMLKDKMKSLHDKFEVLEEGCKPAK